MYKLFISLFLFIAITVDIFAQEKISPGAIKHAVKQAIKEIDAQKKQKEEQFIAQLKLSLEAYIKEWIASRNKEKMAQVGLLVHEQWTELKKRTTPIPYEYYLRDWAYSIVKEDIFKSNSLLEPYRALVEIKEERYIERYHSPDAGNVKDYLHTVIKIIQLNMLYHQDKFVVSELKEGEISILPGWPDKKSE
jgi:hypothetical protein